MSSLYRYELLDLTAAGFERLSSFLRLVFPAARHLTPRYLQWYYAGNPNGLAVGCNAFSGDTLVGHMAAIPIPATMDGVDRRTVFMVNGSVHPEHRGRKLQSRISDALFAEAARLGYVICFGTGNKYSTGPLLTRFRLIGPLDARIGYGMPSRRDDGFVPSFEQNWTDAALEWRLANPECRYRMERRNGQLRISAPSGFAGIGATLYAGPDIGNLPEQGGDLRGHGPLSVWIGRDPGIDWRRSAYVRIPLRLRPSPLNLVYRDLAGCGVEPDPAHLVFRGIDFDAY